MGSTTPPSVRKPVVSVIVPVRNEAPHIAQTLQGLFEQEFPPEEFEVPVIDGQSTDATIAIVRGLQPSFVHLEVLDNPRRLASAARNVGIRHARGEYCVIIDGHCHVTNPNYLRNLVQAFEESGAASVGRPQPLRTPSHSFSTGSAAHGGNRGWDIIPIRITLPIGLDTFNLIMWPWHIGGLSSPRLAFLMRISMPVRMWSSIRVFARRD